MNFEEEHVEKEVKKEKKNVALIILCIVLSILLVLCVGYIVYNEITPDKKTTEKSTKKEKEEKEEVKTRDLSEKEQEVLLEQISKYNNYLSIDYPIEDVKSFSNQKKLFFSYLNLGKTNFDNFMESDLQKVIDEYFGDDSGIVFEDILCDVDNNVFFKYNSARREYSFVDQHGHGGSGTYKTNNYYLDGTVTNDKEYSIDVNILYYEYCSSTCGPSTTYYKNAKDAYSYNNPVFTASNELYTFNDNDYQSIKDKLDITNFKFILDDNGNYGLESVTIK